MVDNQTSNEELLQMGMRAAKQGQRDAARMMFQQVYNRDKRNERAMLGLAQVARSADERRKWLKRVLKIDPNNATAKKALAKMNYKSSANENRTLLIWGTGAAVLFIIVLAVLVIALTG